MRTGVSAADDARYWALAEHDRTAIKESKMPAKRKPASWTVCKDCDAEMHDGNTCLNCDWATARAAAIAEADTWIDGLADQKNADAADRDALVDAIANAFEDAEQRMIDAARERGLMSPMP